MGCGDIIEALRQPFFGRGIETVAVNVRDRQTPIVEDVGDALVADVPQRWGIAWYAFANAAITRASCSFGTNAYATFTDPKAETIGAAVIVVMARPTGNIAVPT